MTDNTQGRINQGSELPTVSGPTVPGLARFSIPPPQIEGYEIVGQLGEAGQGRVWRALQLSTRREVALKVPRLDFLSSGRALARFEREVELAARLTHPNIARIYDSGIYQGIYYYAMELIEGVSLDEYVKQNKLTQRQAVELMRIVCAAIQHAHQNGVIHRDIKPSNIIATKDGQPHIVDFGLATNILEDNTFRTVSLEGEVTGTPAYMSPEQAAGLHEQLDTRTDVYSIGVVFYRVLTGAFPYDVKSSMLNTLHNIRESEPTHPSKIVPDIDRDVEAIILKALAKEPERRYQSAAELRQDIERWLNGLPIIARADSSIYLLRKVIVRHRYTSTVVALLLVIVFGFSAFSFQLRVELRRVKMELEKTKRSLNDAREENTKLATQAVFTDLLYAWHEGQGNNARVTAVFFGEGTREAIAAAFLLDTRPLAQKIAPFRQKLRQREPCFAEFVVAEHYFKDGNRPEALQSYQKCLSYRDYLLKEQWMVRYIKRRLYELTSENRQNKTPFVDKGGGP
jgi:serine/threonine protein kinase